jgi:oxazoline/thiazoline dehydrogenase
MTADAVRWTYALAPDVTVDRSSGKTCLLTATSRSWIDPGDVDVLELLAGFGSSEHQIRERFARRVSDADASILSAALLFRLDSVGLLARTVSSRGRHLASCIPLRPPPGPPPASPPDGPLRLSPHTVARAEDGMVSLERSGTWARMAIHDRDLLVMLHDLSVGRPATAIAAGPGDHTEAAILAVLATMSWCGLLADGMESGWASHDLLFHTRTRGGYARAFLGKTVADGRTPGPREPAVRARATRRVRLETPDVDRLLAGDPPYAVVAARRRSIREQGVEPLTMAQVSEFLFRTLHEREGRRPYPSGGSTYPLQAYLAVHRCRDIAPGLYAYDPALHELLGVAAAGPELDELLADAAAAANTAHPPQVLVVLAAHYARTHRMYGDLSYSLILKETGAVFQAGMMAAAVMGLAACPLGCGNSRLFAHLTGADLLTETAVGEMIVGSMGNGP